jgi:hypothetical protein
MSRLASAAHGEANPTLRGALRASLCRLRVMELAGLEPATSWVR